LRSRAPRIRLARAPRIRLARAPRMILLARGASAFAHAPRIRREIREDLPLQYSALNRS
jgi:hypothetical protein